MCDSLEHAASGALRLVLGNMLAVTCGMVVLLSTEGQVAETGHTCLILSMRWSTQS